METTPQRKSNVLYDTVKRTSIKSNNRAESHLSDNLCDKNLSQSASTLRQSTASSARNRLFTPDQASITSTLNSTHEANFLENSPSQNNTRNSSSTKILSKSPKKFSLCEDTNGPRNRLDSSPSGSSRQYSSRESNIYVKDYEYIIEQVASNMKAVHNTNFYDANSADVKGSSDNTSQNAYASGQSKRGNTNTDNYYRGTKRLNPQAGKQPNSMTNSFYTDHGKPRSAKTDTSKGRVKKFPSCTSMWPTQTPNSYRTNWHLKKTQNSGRTFTQKGLNQRDKQKDEMDIKMQSPRYCVHKKEIRQKSPLDYVNDIAWISKKCSSLNKSCVPERASNGTQCSQQIACALQTSDNPPESCQSDINISDVPKKGIASNDNSIKKAKKSISGPECKTCNMSKYGQTESPTEENEKCITKQISQLLETNEAYSFDEDYNQTLVERLNTKLESAKKDFLQKDNPKSVIKTDYRNKRSSNPNYKARQSASALNDTSDLPSCVNKGKTGEKSTEKQPSESRHGGIKCDSFLNKILKEVAEKRSKPSFRNNVAADFEHDKDTTNESNVTTGDNETENIRTTDEIKQSISSPKEYNSGYQIMNQKSKLILPLANEISVQISKPMFAQGNSYEHSNLQIGCNAAAVEERDKATKKESSPEHSTVSLEVKSVNLSFSCADKHIQNSSRQIRIKWCISPNTNAKWKTNSFVIESVTDQADKAGFTVEECNKKRCTETKTKRCPKTSKDQYSNADAKSVRQRGMTIESESNQSALLMNVHTSPRQKSPSGSKPKSIRTSHTTLRSPSPMQTTKDEHNHRAKKLENSVTELSNILPLEQSKKYHEYYLPKNVHCMSEERVEISRIMSPGIANSTNNLQRKTSAGATRMSMESSDYVARYKKKYAAKILARNHENNLVPRTEDRYLMLQLEWGIFIILVTSVPIVLLLLSLNFYFRAFEGTDKP